MRWNNLRRRDWRIVVGAVCIASGVGCRPAVGQGAGAVLGQPVSPALDAAYVRGLRYLARTQTPEGRWPDGESGPGVAGLAVLAMLARGDDPEAGPWAASIRRALEFILVNQNPATGYIGPSMYHHGLATLALAEAYGAVPDPRLGPALDRAVRLILAAQIRNPMGGWRYSPDAEDADTTVSGAQVVALLAARNAGWFVPEEALDRAIRFYQSCQLGDGQMGYTGPDGGGSPARNAIAVAVAALSRRTDGDLFRRAWAVLRTTDPREGGGYFFYYLYYAAQAFFQADPAAWERWNSRAVRTLLELQGPDGSWSGPHGTAFSTSAALLTLAVNYRLLPIYER